MFGIVAFTRLVMRGMIMHGAWKGLHQNKTSENTMRLLAIIFAAMMAVACGKSGDEAADGSAATAAPTELQSTTLAEGDGAEAVAGSNVTVHYTGWLFDGAAENNQGQKFDSSLDRSRPFSFPLGAGRVIQGWDQGVVGMKVGEKRRLVIPSHLGYGDRGAGNVIPGGATLVFDVELLAVN